MVIIQLTETEFRAAIKDAVDLALSNQRPKVSDELISRREAAIYLKVTLPTLNAWEKKGFIKAVRLGARVYFNKAKLLNNLNNK